MEFTTREIHTLLCLVSGYDTYDHLIEDDGESKKYLNVEKAEIKDCILTKLKYDLLQKEQKL